MKKITIPVLILLLFCGCKNDTNGEQIENNVASNTKLFTQIRSDASGINFQNKIFQKVGFNFTNYDYVYMGAGIVVLDYNNDGLQDLYFVSSFESNKLYKNKGDLTFEDVSKASGVQDLGGFSTGAVQFDVNNDGYQDIYVCKAGALDDSELRKNRLYVNQKDGTFNEEAAKYGLDHSGFSTQAYPFDYDNDGDLDLFVLNHRDDFDNVVKINLDFEEPPKEEISDQLFRNDNGRFTRVTDLTGIGSKSWGLSAIASDFNSDGWTDLFVCNDFWQPDYYYLNNQKGAFLNFANSHLKHISQSSMGSDAADLNNDLLPDLMTVDMMSNDYKRSKENMASMDIATFRNLTQVGYHNQYSSNMLFQNKGYGYFTEIGQYSGITKTDWSWAALLADFDNDGLKDVFVTNGVERDYNHQDTRKKLDSISALGKQVVLEDILKLYPSEPLVNHIYKNQGDFRFQPKMDSWGITEKTFSNGAVYADLDNDGDLEIVTNNIDGNASLYQNNTTNNYIKFKLTGSESNPFAIGAKVYLETTNNKQLVELYPTRGYLSSVSTIPHFGISANDSPKRAIIVWPDGRTTYLSSLEMNSTVALDYRTANKTEIAYQPEVDFNKQLVNLASLGVDYVNKENEFDDYTVQLLLPQKQSTKGTGLAVGDINNDGLDDFFVGNALGATPALYIQNSNGSFGKSNASLWKQEAKYEDRDALFFDADNDNDLDLYVVSGGYELNQNSVLLQDRLYINNGNGSFSKSNQSLPKILESGSTIAAADIDNDGDTDLFIGGDVLPKNYPLPSKSYLLKNENGVFTEFSEVGLDREDLGLVSSAIFTDYDGDKDQDLLITGEWMSPIIFKNDNGTFSKANIESFKNKEGWWFALAQEDFDKDGDIDYVLGNLGENNKFHPTEDKPLFINAKDFDDNGSFDVAMSKIHNGRKVPIRGKECSSEQNPFLLEKIGSYKEFASLDMESIYGEQINDAFKYEAKTFQTMYAENIGNDKFNMTALPSTAQIGPTLSFIISDFNEDGHQDILGIGAIYDAEVETIRYDSNFGYVLLGGSDGTFVPAPNLEPFVVTDAKDAVSISINGTTHYMVVSNNAPLELFRFN